MAVPDDPPGPKTPRQPACPACRHEVHLYFECDTCPCTIRDPFGVIPDD